jgi:hypothetical protein
MSSEPALFCLSGDSPNPKRFADAVFVHGLNPAGKLNPTHAFRTWGGESARDATADFWPNWLGQDLGEVAVWVLQYDSSASVLVGNSASLEDTATSVLDALWANGIGERPLAFVTHSLGGVLVKQMLNDALTQNKSDWEGIKTNTRGVVFLATPHTGADIATYSRIVDLVYGRATILKELEANASHLRKLAEWYRDNALQAGIQTRSYMETEDTKGIRVVDETSANPHVPHATPIPVIGANHFQVAEIKSNTTTQYKSILRFLTEALKHPFG